jgi:hypothetical protein
MGMTWRLKFLRVAFVVAVVGALAMAMAANYSDDVASWFFSF